MAAAPAKIFVGGLNWDTTDDAFKKYFSTFGELLDAMVMRDRITQVSRGFGFVTFKDTSGLDAVLKAGDLELDGRKIDCKAAVPKEEMHMGGGMRTKKIFVGGLLPETTEPELKEYFGPFGGITEAIIMMDHQTNRSRGFGFVTFETEDSVEKVCAVSSHEIAGKPVECKKAVPKQKMPGRGFGRGGFMGGRGGGRGGGHGGYGGYGGYGAGPPGYGAFRGGGGYGPPPGAYGPPPDAYYRGYGAAPPAGAHGAGAGAGYADPAAAAAYGAAAGAGAAGGYGAADPSVAYGAGYGAGAEYGAGYGAYEAQTARSTREGRSYHPYR